MTTTLHVPADRLRAGLAHVADAPRDDGTIAMVVARPAPGEREVQARGTFTPLDGLIGDDWRGRGSSSTPDGAADPDAQVTLISQRWLDLVCDGDRARWPLAGDQVVVDMDLGTDTLDAGDRLQLGTALVEVTAKPHTGCAKFVARYGVEAQRLVASEQGRAMRLRGIYVRVLEAGEAGPGDTVSIVA